MSDRAALRALAERVLCEETGARGVVRLCPRCGSHIHGQPLLTGGPALPRVSLAYTGGLVAVAWAPGPVGIDVEVDGPPVAGYGGRLAWTRAEALLKHAGSGLAHDPRDGLPDDVPTAVLPLPAGLVGTVAGTDVSWRLAGPAAPARPARG